MQGWAQTSNEQFAGAVFTQFVQGIDRGRAQRLGPGAVARAAARYRDSRWTEGPRASTSARRNGRPVPPCFTALGGHLSRGLLDTAGRGVDDGERCANAAGCACSSFTSRTPANIVRVLV
jgi:hypothetical protein